MYHIQLNLNVTAGVLGMPDVIVNFWQAVIAVEDHKDLLRVTAQKLHIVQVTVGNLLPSLTLFPFNHEEAICH